MAYKIEFKSSVIRDLKRIDPKSVERILRGINDMLSNDPGVGEPLHGEFVGIYKLRIGDYRVLYAKTSNTVIILRTKH